MTYIKRLVMHGFKSFAQRTEIPFDKGINVVIGPNGSGKSNVAEALCFVLGRLSAKSIRAAKAKNLLFMGSKYVKPAHEASVELVLDNSNRTFSIDNDEIVISRIVRHNGSSTYKINSDTKTRADILELLAQAGIDHNGFNIIMQGQIQSIVKIPPEDRRKIIEEVAGISVYESRKEKSLHELDKTELKLKEISTIIRERTSYLRNLENERAQALKFRELEHAIKKCKASILQRRLQEKQKELASVRKSIEEKSSQKDKIKVKIETTQKKADSAGSSISEINKHIHRATGIEQEQLRAKISNLRAEIEGLKVRKESFEHRKAEIERRIEEMQKSIPSYEQEIKDLRSESPTIARRRNELSRKKEELKAIEEERRKIYSVKTELSSLKERIKDKERQLFNASSQAGSLLKQIEDYTSEFKHKSRQHALKSLEDLRSEILAHKSTLEEIKKRAHESIREISSAETEIAGAEKIGSQVEKIDICPTCQSKMTESHIKHVLADSKSKISRFSLIINKSNSELEKANFESHNLSAIIESSHLKALELEKEITFHNIVTEKQEQLKKLVEQESAFRAELAGLSSMRDKLSLRTVDSSLFDERYATKMLEIEEASSITEDDLDHALVYKERELEKLKEIIRLTAKDNSEIEQSIEETGSLLDAKLEALEQNEAEEHSLNERFKKLFSQRDQVQAQLQEHNLEISTLQSELRQIEEQINYLKVGNAKLDAEREAIEIESSEFSGTELIQAPIHALEERLQKSQQAIMAIGNVNMRALEVYDEIKKEYDLIQEKVNTLGREKQEILNIIAEIDNKKKRTFMKTFKQVNELFSSNFLKLSSKGQAFLEIEDEENIFEGGLNIVIKLARGKYFDVTSLSGGEQTLVALALLFAIQEYKPYHFYVLDEIDAALDKRNSERLSALLQQYMKAGQYITVTHNDALIIDSNVLYGVSMHDGVSKILSLNLNANESPTLSIEETKLPKEPATQV